MNMDFINLISRLDNPPGYLIAGFIIAGIELSIGYAIKMIRNRICLAKVRKQ